MLTPNKLVKTMPTQARLERFAVVIVAVIGICICIAQLWRIHDLWTAVGYVDTWPVYDRLMKLREGHLSLDHYFFDPHGLHLHFIIYFLYLLDVLWGSGRQLVPHFASLLSIVGLTATLAFVLRGCCPRENDVTLRLCLLISGALILLSGVSEATSIPFQAVVVVSRFIYILLLSVLVYCQFYPNKGLHIAALTVSCVAASFYGASGIFAIEVLLIHVVFFRGWRLLLFSSLPLASYSWLIGYYAKPSLETIEVSNVLHSLSFPIIAEISIGTICYYGSALTLGWPRDVNINFGVSEFILLGFSSVVCATTVIWAGFTLVSLTLKARRGVQRIEMSDLASCLMALLSLFVFASSCSAALLWVARARIFGPALGMPPHFAVLTSNRYAVFASLGFLVFLYISVSMKRRQLGTIIASASFAVIATCAFNTLSAANVGGNRNSLEYSATALLMGMSPTDEEGNAVWPGARADAYWAAELPDVSKFIQSAGISYAYRMPALGQFSGGLTTKIDEYSVSPVPEDQTIGRITGRVAAFDSESIMAPVRFFPIVTLHSEVVGYAVRTGSNIRGHLRRVIPSEAIDFTTMHTQMTAVAFTDANWRNGIWVATKAGMFIVPAADSVGNEVAIGDKLTFAKSGTRKVVRIGERSTSSPVSIEVEGSSLDPQSDGYPNLIRRENVGTGAIPMLFLSRRD